MVLATVWTSSYWFVVIIVIVLVLWVQRALIIATVIPTRRRRILVVLSIIGVVLCLLARLLALLDSFALIALLDVFSCTWLTCAFRLCLQEQYCQLSSSEQPKDQPICPIDPVQYRPHDSTYLRLPLDKGGCAGS